MATKRRTATGGDMVTRPNSPPRRAVKWAVGIAFVVIAIILVMIAISFVVGPDYKNVLG